MLLGPLRLALSKIYISAKVLTIELDSMAVN